MLCPLLLALSVSTTTVNLKPGIATLFLAGSAVMSGCATHAWEHLGRLDLSLIKTQATTATILHFQCFDFAILINEHFWNAVFSDRLVA